VVLTWVTVIGGTFKTVTAMAPERVEDLLVQPFVKDPTKTVEALITETSAKVGENIRVKNFYRMEI
jgi:translation elongation factor EF-Ts